MKFVEFLCLFIDTMWCKRNRFVFGALGWRNGLVNSSDHGKSSTSKALSRQACEQWNSRARGWLSKLTVHEIVHKQLVFRNVCARWVPKHLTELHETTRVGVYLQVLTQCRNKGVEFLSRIVTTDETWVHHGTPGRKIYSRTWKHPRSPVAKSSRAHCLRGMNGKSFWNRYGMLLIDFMGLGSTINAERYWKIMEKLK
jgi:hypothetical protein